MATWIINKPVKQKCNDPAVKGLKKGYYGVKNRIKRHDFTRYSSSSLLYLLHDDDVQSRKNIIIICTVNLIILIQD